MATQENLLHIATNWGNIDQVRRLINKGTDVNIKDDNGMTPLHIAAERGYVKIVDYLVGKGADIGIQDKIGRTPLHLAAEKGRFENTLKHLVDEGAGISIKDNKGRTPLHIAVKEFQVRTMEFLVDRGADINSKDNEGLTPLHMAAKKGRCEQILGYLVGKGADINIKDKNGRTPLHIAVKEFQMHTVEALVVNGADINSRDNHGMTPLHVVAEKGDRLDIVKYLLDKRADINIKDYNGQTPMHTAAKDGNQFTMQGLVKLGADINLKDNDGRTPLDVAIERGYVNIAKTLKGLGMLEGNPMQLATEGRCMETLVDKGADIANEENSGMNSIHEAARQGDLDTVRHLIDEGTDVNISDDHGITPLHLAAERGHPIIVEYLVNKGADINIQDKIGWTPSHMAAAKGRFENTLECLVDKGAHINIKDNYGRTPLHIAVREFRVKTVEFLVENKADINSKDEHGWTPLHIAAGEGRCDDTLKYLVAKGADLDIKNNNGWTPLHIAVREFQVDTVKFLAEKGADINTEDNEGTTPLHVAAKKGESLDIVEYLINKEANINIKDYNGQTPMHTAAKDGNKFTMEVLVELGADINIKDNDGRTPLDVADERGYGVIAEHFRGTGMSEEMYPTSNLQRGHTTEEKTKTNFQLERLFEKYRHQRKIKHKSVKCLFTGPPRVGKTTLKKRLLKTIKNLISSHVVSPSGGLEKPISVVIGETRGCVTVVMQSDLDWQPQHELLDEAQIVLEFIDHTHHQSPSTPVPDLPTPVPSTPTPVSSTPPPIQPTSPATSPIPEEREADTLDDAKRLMQEVLSCRKLRSIKDIEKTTTLYFMDTGGQPEFHEIMPIVLNGPALHLIFFNLTFDLDEPIPIRFCHRDGTNSIITYMSSYTGKQMIFQLLSSLYYFSKSLAPDSEPAAVLIGTHLDQLNGQGEMKINDSLNQLFNNVEFHDKGFLTYPMEEKNTIFTPVNNYSGDENEIQQLQAFLRQVIVDCFSPVELPSSWLLFHLLLRHRYENSPGVCTLSDCRALAKGCGLDKKDIPQVLRYIHQHLGTILFYEDVPGLNELVICDPNVLFEKIYLVRC